MQLRTKKESLHFMRSITKDCCSEANRSTHRILNERSGVQPDQPLVLHASQKWNESHLQLFKQESFEYRQIQPSIIFSVDHYQHENDTSPRYPNCTLAKNHQLKETNKRTKPSITYSQHFPEIDVAQKDLTNFSSANLPSCSQDCNKTDTKNSDSRKRSCRNSTSNQQESDRQISTFFSTYQATSTQSKTFECSSYRLPISRNFHHETSLRNYEERNVCESSRYCSHSPNQPTVSHTYHKVVTNVEDRTFYQVEASDTEELISRETETNECKCCSATKLKPVHIVILVTVLALVALGSSVYIGE